MRYWQFSKFSKWLESKAGIEHPVALPWGKWDEHYAECRKRAPVTMWITRTLFPAAQAVICWPYNKLDAVRIFMQNAYGETHVLSGNLKPGKWYDLSYRLERCLFEELVRFVEVEKGLEHLRWEMSDDSGIDCPGQVDAAKEQYAIYKWYTTAYKNRVDSMDASGLRAFYKDLPEFCEIPDESLPEWKQLVEAQRTLESQYDAEDEEMLIRLIKIRRSLWT